MALIGGDRRVARLVGGDRLAPPRQLVTGAAALVALAGQGSAGVALHGSGGAALQVLAGEGSAKVGLSGSGGAALSALAASGSARVALSASGGASLSQLNASGTATVPSRPSQLLSSSGMWLSASRGVTIDTGASSWVDQCASPVTFSQSTAAQQPTPNTSPTRLRFDGSNDYMFAASASKHQWTTTAYFAAWVRRLNTATGDRYLWSQWDASDVEQLILRDRNSSNYFEVVAAISGVAFATAQYPKLTVNAWQFAEMIFDGSQATANNRVKVYYGGVEQTRTGGSGTMPTSINAAAAFAMIGTFQGTSGTSNLNFDVAAIYTDKTIPSASVRAALMAFEAPA